MIKPNYNHRIKDFAGRNCIIIEDENLGGMSVTNAIEDVVKEIEKQERIEAINYMIVYKDSEGSWDGWDHRKKQFIHLDAETWPHAVEAYIQRQLNQSPVKNKIA